MSDLLYTIREYTIEDLENIYSLLSDQKTMEHWPTPFSYKEAKDWLEMNIDSYKTKSLGRLGIFNENFLIGDIGFLVRDKIDFGFIIRNEYQNKGIGEFYSRKIINEYFESNFEPIYLNTAKDNINAIKLGFVKKSEFYNSKNRNKLTEEFIYDGIIKEYHFENEYIKISFTNFGASLTSIETKDYMGKWNNILLKYLHLNDYRNNPAFMGSIVGPTAGRIKDGKFLLNNNEYILDKNFFGHNIHGGWNNLSHSNWDVQKVENGYKLILKHKGNGFLVDVEYSVEYLINENVLSVIICATPKEDTIINLTLHPYFKLDDKLELSETYISIPSKYSLFLDNENIPTGELSSVEDTKYDFRNEEKILSRGEYDNVWLLDEKWLTLYSRSSKREILFKTNQNYVVIFTQNGVEENILQSGRKAYIHEAVAIEFQNIPNGINISEEHGSIVRKGETYTNKLDMIFTTRD
jgi:aldose 1-epimerase